MFLLKNSFKWSLLKKPALILVTELVIFCKDTSIFNLDSKKTLFFNLCRVKSICILYVNLIYAYIFKSTAIFNKTTKKLKKCNSRILINTTLNKIQSIFNYSASAIDLNSNFNESSTVFYFLLNSNNPLKIIKGGGGKNINVTTFFRVKELEIRENIVNKANNALNMVLDNIICLFRVFLFFLTDFYCLIFFILIENKSIFLSIIANFISSTNVLSFNTSSNNTNKFNNTAKNINKALNILILAIKKNLCLVIL